MHPGKDAKALLLAGAQCCVPRLHVPTCAKERTPPATKWKGEQEHSMGTRGWGKQTEM